jgi:type II secretory pathway pseudopilin PulG
MMQVVLNHPRRCRRGSGFAYVEVLVAVVLLAVLLAPALDALTNGVLGSGIDLSARHMALRNKMEAVLSKPFSELYGGTGGACSSATTAVSNFSDPAGSTDRRIVVRYRFRYQSNACTTNDSGVLMVKVYYESDGNAAASALHTLTSKWW